MSQRRVVTHHCCCVLFALAVPVANALGAREDPQTLLRGAVARSEMLLSGALIYTIHFGLRSSGPKYWDTYDKAYLWEGDRWLQRLPDDRVVFPWRVCSVDGKFLSFFRTPKSDGGFRVAVHVEDPGAQIAKFTRGFRAPVFAGSIWAPQTRSYMAQHADRAKLQGTTRVNGVDVVTVELMVPKGEIFKAIDGIPPFAGQSDSLLRLQIAPAMGFVIPRYEFRTAAGQRYAVYEASDFRRYGRGVYFPRRARADDYLADGDGFFFEYTIAKVERLNEDIPDEEFYFTIPEGTWVTDKRTNGTGRRIRLDHALRSDRIEEVLGPVKRPAPIPVTVSWRPHLFAIAVVIFLVIVGRWWFHHTSGESASE